MIERTPRLQAAAIIALAGAVAALLALVVHTQREIDRLTESVTPVVFGFAALQSAAGPALDSVSGEIEAFRGEPLVFPVSVDEIVPIDVVIPVRQTVEVQVSELLPIQERFDTTVTIQGPFGSEIDVDVTIPVDIEVPIELTVPIEIDEQVAISTEFPLRLDVPVSIDLDAPPIGDLLDRLQRGISDLGTLLGG